MSSDLAIDLEHVAKTYGGLFRKKTPALRGIEMRVHRGEVFGLLGPNGAGKSTLVKILMTVIRPSRCSGSMLGGRVGHKPTLGRVGYLPEHHAFPGYLSGAQVIDFFGAMAGVPRRERRRRSDELLELVGMTDWAKRKLRSYSKGMRQRIGIAQALVNNPELILLDEPTDGVDPVGRRDIRDVLQRLKDEGRTVFINSHLLSELEMVCDRVAILVKGVVAQQGTIDELTEGQRGYLIRVAETDDATNLLREALPKTSRQLPPPEADPLAKRAGFRGLLPSGESIEIDRNVLRLGLTEPEQIQPIVDEIRRRAGVIDEIRAIRPSLEDLFMQAVTDPTTGEALTPGAANKSQIAQESGR
ncbi:MAG: ATP-binding cassette domain-containing protein [Planctomycetota bacterium]